MKAVLPNDPSRTWRAFSSPRSLVQLVRFPDRFEALHGDSLRVRQRALVMAGYCVTIYPAFFLLDVVVYPDHAIPFALMRTVVFLMGAGILYVGFQFRVSPRVIRRFAQFAALVATFFVALMCAFTEGFHSNYLIGLILCFLAISTIEIFHPVGLTIALCSVLGVYLALCFFLGPEADSATVVSAVFFGAGGVFLSVVAGVLLLIQYARIQMAKQKILDQKTELEKAYSHQRDFFSTMTHELRTPLNSILGFNELVTRREKNLKEKSSQNLKRLDSCARQLLKIINDILDLSKVEAGHLEISVDSVDLRDILEEVTESTKALIGQRNIEVILDAPDKIPLVTDGFRVRQILTNLAGNAAKFTAQGSIRIEVDAVDNGVHLRVRDTGLGISEEQQKKIFEAFHQVRNVESSGGTGLGLSIVSHMTHLLGGNVQVDSIEGLGSCFTVTLPNMNSLARVA